MNPLRKLRMSRRQTRQDYDSNQAGQSGQGVAEGSQEMNVDLVGDTVYDDQVSYF